MHLDGCHYHTTVFACTRCRATTTSTMERDLTDPQNAIWCEEQYEEVRRDERGRFCKPRWVVKECQRCDELKAGSARRHDIVVLDKDGTVIEERHEEWHDDPEPDDDDNVTPIQ